MIMYGKYKIGVEHIRYFTLCALKDVLIYNNFRIKKILGFYEKPGETIENKNIVNIIVEYLDKFFSFFPSLSSGIGVFCKK